MSNAIVGTQLVGTRCPNCGDVRFPPRSTCAQCTTTTDPICITSGQVISAVRVTDGVMLRVRSDLGPLLVLPANGALDEFPIGTAIEVGVVDGLARARPRDPAST